MEPVEGALLEALTRDWLDCLPNVVAGLAEVVGAEAEPAGCFAAVPALVHDVLCAMLLAASLSSRLPDRKTLST